MGRGLDSLQCTGHPTAENYPTQNVGNAKLRHLMPKHRDVKLMASGYYGMIPGPLEASVSASEKWG